MIHYENKLYCLPYFDLPLLITSFSIFKLFLNRDDQQFQQHQEHEQSPLTLNHWTHKRSRKITLAIQDWNRHNNVTGLCQLMGSPPLLIFVSPKAIQISTNDNNKKTCTDLLPPNKTTHNHKNEHKHRRTLCNCWIKWRISCT